MTRKEESPSLEIKEKWWSRFQGLLRATTTLTALMEQRRTSRVLYKKVLGRSMKPKESWKDLKMQQQRRNTERERGTHTRTNTQTHKERHTQSTDESGERDKELTVNRATSSHS